jgi:predicted Na+-dependent transporter
MRDLSVSVTLSIALLVLLPQLAGLLVTRFVRRASWTAWPAAAIAVFGVVFHRGVWVPACEGAEQAFPRCGTAQVALAFVLVAGLLFHLGVGVTSGLLARKLRRARASRDAVRPGVR